MERGQSKRIRKTRRVTVQTRYPNLHSNASPVAYPGRVPHRYSSPMIVKDHWRITTAAIQLEMERIAGLLEKSVHFHSRTSAPHPLRQRVTQQQPDPEPAAGLEPVKSL